MRFTDLPPELIEEVLIYCDPIDVACAAQTCSALRTIVYCSDDSKLWRELYLMQPFDDPRICVSQDGRPRSSPIFWKDDLQRIMRARTVVTSEKGLAVLKPGEVKEVLETFLMLVCYVPPWREFDASLSQISLNLVWVAALLKSGFLDQVEKQALSDTERQLVSRLHTYFGLTQDDLKPEARVKSRAFVYCLRNYRPENEYGPLLASGKVNWIHMQAIHHVVSMHLVDMSNEEPLILALFPMTLPFTQAAIPRGLVLDEEKDWAGVEGAWTVNFCFCDHRDLLSERSNCFAVQTPS